MSINLFVNPQKGASKEKDNIFLSSLYGYLSEFEHLDLVSLDNAELIKRIKSKRSNGECYFINWLDVLCVPLKINLTKNSKINEVFTLLLFPFFIIRIFKFYLVLRKFLKNNSVYFYCHDLKTFSQFTSIKVFDAIVRPVFLKYSEKVLFAEESCKEDVEMYYKLRISDYEVMHLGRYHSLDETISQGSLRKKHNIPKAKMVIVFAGTVRANRDLGKDFERKLLDQGIYLIRVGRGHKKRFDDKNLRVISGFVEQQMFDEIVACADYVLSPSEKYLTSAVERASIGMGIPVIGNSFGSTRDMCQGCFIDVSIIQQPNAPIFDLIPCPGSDEYFDLQLNCAKRDKERSWREGFNRFANLFL